MSILRLRSFVVSGASMSPTLGDGARFIGWRGSRDRSVRRGKVVAFMHPLRPGFWMVKRVVGIGGEVITIDMGEVLIDGKAGLDHWGSGFSSPDGRWAVPPGKVFVLSDQRPLTRDDSRSFGPIAASGLYRMIFPPRLPKSLPATTSRPPDTRPT